MACVDQCLGRTIGGLAYGTMRDRRPQVYVSHSSAGSMVQFEIKLKPKLFDLFQHCETKCSAGCCGWDAFDFSEHWLTRWCDFREPSIVREAQSEIARLRADIKDLDLDQPISVSKFFAPTGTSLLWHLDIIAEALRSQSSENDARQ